MECQWRDVKGNLICRKNLYHQACYYLAEFVDEDTDESTDDYDLKILKTMYQGFCDTHWYKFPKSAS